jgi:hypothetical protein
MRWFVLQTHIECDVFFQETNMYLKDSDAFRGDGREL